MKIIPVILLLVFSCAVCAQELKEKYAEADGFRQKYEAGYFWREYHSPLDRKYTFFAGMRSRLLQVLILYW